MNHKDGNKENNHVQNLEWVTHEENIHHAEKLGLVPHHCGQLHSRSKCTNEQIHLVCRLLESKNSTSKNVADIAGVTKAIVDNIRTRSSWTQISSMYNIPRKCIKHTIDEKNNVLRVYNSGKYKNMKDLAQKAGLPNPETSGASFANHIINKFGKTSTTIENAEKQK